ncbi:MAG: TM0106 family RecB-like putative nuclease [Candidatus Buchananbacteria bacterium]
MKNITATDFYDYTQCKHLVYLEKNGDLSLKTKVSDFVRMLWYRGIQHEELIIKYLLETKKDKTFAEISKSKPAGKTTFDETLELMKKGIDYIYQGVLMDGNLIGRPDLLEKVEGSSNFGNYYYIPVDVKAGRGYEGDDFDEGKIKKTYSLQLTFYALLLGKVQGFSPQFGKIFNIDGQSLEYNLNIEDDSFKKIFNEIKQMSEGKELYQPVIGGKCGMCQWKSVCKKWAEDNDDLSLLFYVGETKYGIQQYGVDNIDELLKLSLDEWLDKLPQIKKEGYFKGIAEKSFINIYKRALVHKQGKEVIYSQIDFPKGNREIHFDIEDDPTQNIVYMYGFWIRENGKEYYKAILAETLDDEEKAARELWDFLKENQGTPIYHYSHHEKSTLKRLQERYKLDADVLNQFIADTFDLYEAIKKNTDFPLPSYGLKSICHYLGFNWSAEDAGGANSIEWYSQYLKGDKKMMDKILKYNEEDCKATAFLKDYLINR